MSVSTTRLFGIILGLLLTAHLVLLGFFQITSIDTWWHLKQGELYVTTRSLPAQDPFAFTTQGREWIKYSWLSDILFYLIYAEAGAPGLVLLRLLLLFLVALLLYKLLRSCGLHPLAGVFLVFLASLALRFRLFIRPEILSFPMVLAVMAILLRLQTARPWTAFLLLPVQVVWTNIHSSFVFGIGLPGIVLLANLLPQGRMTAGWGRLRLDRARMGHLAVAVTCLPLVSLLNPQGVSTLLFPFRQNSMTRLTLFPEWAPVWVLLQIDPVWWETVMVLAIMFLAFLATAFLLLAREGRIDPVGWGIVLSIGVYAIFRNRALPYFVLALLPLLALALVRLTDALLPEDAGSSRRWLEWIAALGCVLVLSASILDQAFLTPRFPPGFGARGNFFPQGAAAFLEKHQLDGRLFNSYKFGGYLIWRRWPANQVLIDGRYDAVLFDQLLLERYLEALVSRDVLDRITTAYGVEILVLDADPDRRVTFLDNDPEWARVYWDPVAEVFVRQGGRHAGLIADHEYRLTHPAADLSYLAAYERDPATWARVLAELRRAVADNPENVQAWLALAQVYRGTGSTGLAYRLEALTHAVMHLAGTRAAGRLHAERAGVLLQLGQVDEAKAEALEALRLDGKALSPRWVLASVAEHHGAWKEAREQLRTILARLEPGHPEAPIIRRRLDVVERSLHGQSGH